MDWFFIFIAAGFVLTGIIIASPIAYVLGRKAERQSFEYQDAPETVTDEILKAEVIQ